MEGVGKQFHVTSPHSLLQLRLCVYQNQRRILCMEVGEAYHPALPHPLLRLFERRLSDV